MNDAKQATPAAELERQICSATEPKNEREWWAHREIERLRDRLSVETLALVEALARAERAETDAEIGRKWRADSSLETWFPYTAEELARLRLDEARINKLAHMALYQKVSIVDTGVIPYRVCLNGAVLGDSLREVIDKAIEYPPMEAS